MNFLFLALAVLLAMPLSARGKPLLTLEQAVALALGENPALQAKQAQTEAKKARVGVERALEAPMFGVEFEEVPIGTADVTEGMMTNYSFVQKFAFPTKYISISNKARREFFAAQSEYEAAKLEIVKETEHAFHDLYFLEEALKINRELQGIFARLAGGQKGEYKSGGGKGGGAQNFAKAQVDLEMLRSEGAMLAAERVRALATLNILIHRDPSEEIRPAGLPPLNHRKHPLTSYAELEKIVLEKHPEVSAARQMRDAAASEVSLKTQNALLPDFQTRFTYNQRYRQENAWTGEAMITIPWLWGGQRKELKEAKALERSAIRSQEWRQSETSARLKESWARFESAKKMHAILKGRALPHALLAFRSALAVYETGGGDFLMLVDSARELKKVKLETLKALVEIHRALTHLQYATGGVL